MSDNMPLVTIITPSYNQAQFLESTIRSVIEQSYPSLEYIVIDGGSTDGSVDIIRRYESHLTYWVSEPDAGQADAINKGLLRARGRYVAWLNSDDIYLPGTIDRAINTFNEHPSAGLVYANCAKIDELGRPLAWPQYRPYTLIDLLSMCVIAQPTVFMRREILESVGGLDITYHCLMDHRLWIAMACVAPLGFVNEYWAGAREHSQAKNTAQRLNFAPEARRIIEQVAGEPTTAELVQQNPRRIEAGLKVFEAGYWLADGQSGRALQYYLSAIRAHPPRAMRAWRLMLLSTSRVLKLSWIEKFLYYVRARAHASRYR